MAQKTLAKLKAEFQSAEKAFDKVETAYLAAPSDSTKEKKLNKLLEAVAKKKESAKTAYEDHDDYVAPYSSRSC